MFHRVSFLLLLVTWLNSACASTPKTAPTALPPTITLTASLPAKIQTTPTSIPTESPVPTEAPKLALDATKHPGEWDLSTFTPEQQTWINQVMTNPDHAPMEAKNFYDQVRIEGIKEQTEDQNVTLEKYAEWLYANKIRETAPLPFAWYIESVGNKDNFPMINTNGNPGYTIEGYPSTEGSGRTGFGENRGRLTQEIMDLQLKGRKGVGQNRTRDTAFGEPFFIVYPSDSMARGDLMALMDIAGEYPDTAQLAVLRTWNNSGQIKYSLLRLQYVDEKIQAGDASCEEIPLTESKICPPGTVLKGGVISQWDDISRRHKVDASRAKMIELMNLAQFAHPVRLTLQADAIVEAEAIHSNIFMDGTNVMWDIKIPTVPPEFFK